MCVRVCVSKCADTVLDVSRLVQVIVIHFKACHDIANPLENLHQPGVIVVLQWCHSGVTVVSQWCYSGVTVALQWRYSGVTVVLQWCYSGVTVVLQWCYSGVTVVLQ
jgi:hypothetical protein